MQDGAPTTATDVLQAALKAPESMKSYGQERDPDSMVNTADRVIPPEGDDKKNAKSKFARDMGRPLSGAELMASLEIDQLDESKIKVKKAWLLDDNEVKIELTNGDSITFGRDEQGYARISGPPNNGEPWDATTTIAMAALAAARGWDRVNVNSINEEFRALSFLAIENAGSSMIDPPPSGVIDKYRVRFQIALATGVDPVAEAHRREVEAAANKLDSKSPAVDKIGAQSVKPPGEADKTPATKMPEQEERQKPPPPAARARSAPRM